jgi:IS1 family transposase
MNVLPIEKQTQIISALVEGNSIRATARMVGVEHKTVMRVLLRVGQNCADLLDSKMQSLPCKIMQADEIWCYVGKHERFVTDKDNPVEVGDQYVFVAMDSETKLIPCFRVGKRNAENTWFFIQDLQERLASRVQLTTDGFGPYRNAVEDAFGAGIDFAQLVKLYSASGAADTRYSPGEFVHALPIPITGNPKPNLISTSHIERQNLTIRMQLRRFTRLTNAFSKKLSHLKAACAMHFAHYNFCRVHQTLRVTPAMAAGIADHIFSIEEIANLLEGSVRIAA